MAMVEIRDLGPSEALLWGLQEMEIPPSEDPMDEDVVLASWLRRAAAVASPCSQSVLVEMTEVVSRGLLKRRY